MNKIINYLLVGNMRLHWAKEENNNYKFSHTSLEEPIPLNIKHDELIWASVGNYQTENLKKENEITISDINLKNLPKNFGIDRALCCISALKIVNNPYKKNLLIADFGTTLSLTKIDAEGKLIGGQLIPGFLTQLKSMAENTKNLNLPNNLVIPTNNFQLITSKAMLKGVSNSLLGAIKLSFDSNSDILIVCGGDSALMGGHLNKSLGKVRIEPNLVMLGMIILQKNKSQLSNI